MSAEYQRRGADRGIQADGRRLWVFSQSRLKQVELCPERGRRDVLGLMPEFATDSTSLGTAVHAVIEACITDMIEDMGPWALEDMVSVACSTFDTLMLEPIAKWVKVKSAPPIHRQISNCLITWYGQILPTLSPVSAELHFGPLTIHEDDKRIIQLEGTIDYIDAVTGLADWKTAGRTWIEWEHRRWDIQPTVYLWAIDKLENDCGWPLNDAPWTWHVMNTDGSYQRIETTRGQADFDWLKARCLTLALTLEAELPAWPKNDTSALCSPKYCGAYDQCKGQFVADPAAQR